jgi:hypothetical protein
MEREDKEHQDSRHVGGEFILQENLSAPVILTALPGNTSPSHVPSEFLTLKILSQIKWLFQVTNFLHSLLTTAIDKKTNKFSSH